ncbi:MAG: hypothetical protein WKG07_19885 [Hymenobacter sp.]
MSQYTVVGLPNQPLTALPPDIGGWWRRTRCFRVGSGITSWLKPYCPTPTPGLI